MLDIYKCKAGKIKKERGIRKSKRNRVDILDRLTRKDDWENSWEKTRRKWRRESWKHMRENILGRGKINKIKIWNSLKRNCFFIIIQKCHFYADFLPQHSLFFDLYQPRTDETFSSIIDNVNVTALI